MDRAKSWSRKLGDRQSEDITRNCPKCDKEFTVRYKSGNKFCSKSCASSFNTHKLHADGKMKNAAIAAKKANTGMKRTPEQCKRIGAKALGVKHSLERREASLKNRLRGDKSPLWKGGVTKEKKHIKMSGEYGIWRQRVFERDNWTCQECNEKGGKINAHHIKRFAFFPELRFDVENGQTLCFKCHMELHKKAGTFSHKPIAGETS
jgi:hypothetical protein